MREHFLLGLPHQRRAAALVRHAQEAQSLEARRVAATEFGMSAQHSGGALLMDEQEDIDQAAEAHQQIGRAHV